MNKTRTVWSLILVIFILLVAGVVYYFNKPSYALFSDEVTSKKTIELTVSSENTCNNNVNPPALDDNMIPVYFDDVDKTWKKADKDNKDNSWYNYCEKKWANVVTVKNNRDLYVKSNIGTTINEEDISAMFVWIPRYKYQVWNYNKEGDASSKEGEILLAFENAAESTGDIKCSLDSNLDEVCVFDQKTCDDKTCNGKTYTPPGFKDGSTGLWVSKFELSGDESDVSIAPNKVSLRNKSIKEFNDIVSNMTSLNNNYGFSKDLNIHMINNEEWGAVAYLANSKYGISSKISNNNCDKYITGIGATKAGDSENTAVCSSSDNAYSGKYGMLSSTTGNVYGIYDMNGGSYEYVLGVSSDNGMIAGSSGYGNGDEIDNLNLYRNTDSSFDLTISKLGDAIREVRSGGFAWYGASNYVTTNKWPWFVRGGSTKDNNISGIFSSSYSSGSAAEDYSTRVVISK